MTETAIHRITKDVLREKIREIMTKYECTNYKDSTDIGIGHLYEYHDSDAGDISEQGKAFIEEILELWEE